MSPRLQPQGSCRRLFVLAFIPHLVCYDRRVWTKGCCSKIERQTTVGRAA